MAQRLFQLVVFIAAALVLFAIGYERSGVSAGIRQIVFGLLQGGLVIWVILVATRRRHRNGEDSGTP
jgi:hypothetical protein